MNTKMKFMPVLLGAVLAFTACEHHDVYDPDAAKKVTDLVVPDGFDWKMTKSARVALTSSVETNVEIYSDKACNVLLAEMHVTPQGDTCSVCVDRNASGVYIRYTQEDGKTNVVPVNFGMTKSDSGDWNWGEWDIKKAKKEDATGGVQSVACYPSFTSCGTLLFEDMWPQMGDYDFNDVAVWYQIKMSSLASKSKDKDEVEKVKKIEIAVRLNALGGQYPCEFCLKLDEDNKDIKSAVGEGKVGRCIWENRENAKEDALFVFSWPGLKTSGYYNTETPINNNDLENNWVLLTIELKPDDKGEYEDIEFDDFDFFIRRTDNKYEIHMKGYDPSDEFEDKYEEIVKNEDFNLDDDEYSTRDNFVWGLNVPWAINHAKENTDFGDAYSGFKEWVTSGKKLGNSDNWYKPNKDSDKRINMVPSNHGGTSYFKK